MNEIIQVLIGAGIPTAVATVLTIIMGFIFTRRNKIVIGDTNISNKSLKETNEKLVSVNERLSEQIDIMRTKYEERLSNIEESLVKKEEENNRLLELTNKLTDTIEQMTEQNKELYKIKGQYTVALKQMEK